MDGSGSASVTITVLGTDPTVSIETEDQTSLEARFSSLKPQATVSADSDGTIATYEWMPTTPILMRECSVTRR